MKKIKVALVGQPNVGKSMLINSISNSRLHVGNFSGVTVEKSEIAFKHGEYDFTIVDLPGTYAFSDYTIEERVTHNYLLDGDYDLIINVVDSTNLAKNLQLSAELMSMGKKIVIALNMIDEANKDNIAIDEKLLSSLLNIDCVKTSATSKIGLDELVETSIKTYESKQKRPKLIFSEPVEEEIENLIDYFKRHKFNDKLPLRDLSIKLLQNEKLTYKRLHDDPVWTELQPILLKADSHISVHHDTEDVTEIFAQEYFSFINGVINESVVFNNIEETDESFTQKLDKLLINRYIGIPIFLFMMWSLFQLTFVLGSIPMDWIDSFFVWAGEVVGSTISNPDIKSLVVDGIISGVGAVVLFIPNIVILFVGIALLESTGYMSRVAFLLDGFFHKFGLHGQSFIPLVTGFGCSIPAYMSARVLKNDMDRLLTLYIIGFMSCGAKLPVYVLFVGAFFSEEMAGNVLFGIYVGGAMLGLIAAKILKLTVFKSEEEPFVMEMPKYRLPSLKLIWHTVSNKTWMYLRKAGTFIAAASMLVWFMSNYPKNDILVQSFDQKISLTQDESKKEILEHQLQESLLAQSYLGILGKTMEGVFKPLGFDWKMAVALHTGLAAKEVVVSTLGVLYSLGSDVNEADNSLKDIIKKEIPFASGVAFIVFIMIYLPCLAASVVFTREAGGIKYFIYLFVLTSLVAYLLSFIAYRLALII